MPYTNAPLWPRHAANNSEASAGNDPWGLGTAIETQARLWNQLLDVNRSLWSLYTPWLQTAPWLWNAALAPQDVDDAGVEPATTVDGVPDALELQARSWNRFLDAHRNFWTSINWPVPGAPWIAPAADDEASEQEEAEETKSKSSRGTSASRTAARKSKGSRSSRAG
jgi:hypothetical protein